MYGVNENSGMVTICARVRSPFPVRPDCELHFSFSVSLVASPATADGVSYFTFCMSLLHYSLAVMVTFFTPDTLDYSQSVIGLTFPVCESIVCAEIGIVNDNVMEQLEEEFTVSLQSSNTDGRVRAVEQPYSTVIIIDDDG